MRHFKKVNKEFLADLAAYISSYSSLHNAEHTVTVESALSATDDYYERSYAICDSTPRAAAPKMARACEETATIILPDKKPTFQQNLFKIIDSRGVKDSAVYKKADIDRRLFSKIRADEDYHPSKSTAVKLCLALELDIAETERLLETAGYCLSLSDTADLVLRYCIEHRTFRLIEVNEALDYFGEEIL